MRRGSLMRFIEGDDGQAFAAATACASALVAAVFWGASTQAAELQHAKD
jgi:hypothetical protein